MTSLRMPTRSPMDVPVIATLHFSAHDEWAQLTYRPQGTDSVFAGWMHLGAQWALRAPHRPPGELELDMLVPAPLLERAR